MITIYDIAKRTGYSPTTVSKVFNNYNDVSAKTRGKILDAAKEMGYLPNSHARTLMTKRSWTIGILFNEPTGVGIRHPFFNGVIDSFKKTAEAEGYDLMFISGNIGGKSSSYLEHCRFRSVDGVIVIMADRKDPGLQELLESGIPCFLLDFESPQAGTICSDNINGSFLAVQYLYELGHRQIAHISGGTDTFAGQQRQLGYTMAMNRLKLGRREEYIPRGGGFFSLESGYEAMNRLLDLEQPPTAVLAAGDNLALGAIKAIRSRGLQVPEHISVIGFDDIEAAGLVNPALTTIRQNVQEMGSRAAKMLIHSIETVCAPESVVIPVELVIRDSCRAV
ncbi:LacI family DNA-binding transcriptional regulator [Paenibacillus apii]|uniref:LacI family DNA-binding transcriptional regulator n=1 Tax=Paenibacillus apii TaxID=1850370 RepID=UPI00143A7F46|nr:LacI family DNA-binding transcriptional regulator [Paenibacillus apii]NJJ42424.1 LacI family transcriptional regulator [Paenibacillus apii]